MVPTSGRLSRAPTAATRPGDGYLIGMSESRDPNEDGEVSEVSEMNGDDADTPIADGDATAGYPDSESGEAQEPEPEAGPNADVHRDEETR